MFPLFIKFYLKLWDYKEDWAICYRQKYMLRGSNTTNYVEVVFRIMKDGILNRVMAFSLIQLVDYILTRYEMYMEKMLIDFTNGRDLKALLKRMLPKQKDNVSYEVKKFADMQGVFKVTQSGNKNEYCVDIYNGTCSCAKGTTGALCSHASTVILYMEDEFESGFNLVSVEAKETMYYVATGRTCPINWLKPLKEVSVPTNNNMEILDCEHRGISKVPSEEPLIQQMEEVNNTLSGLEKLELENLFNRITKGVQDQPNIFVPAVQKMLRNTSEFAQTETGLITALHTFGKYTGLRRKKCLAEKKNYLLVDLDKI